jgi:outer membrane protein with beta-barrel domain
MKKTIITLSAFILFMYAANAQKARIGITAGSTLANYKIKADGEDQSGNSKAGFTAGVIVNLPAGKNFMIQPGIHWVGKGTKDEEDGHTASLTANSIEIPVNFLYTSNGGFFIGAGPSASFAVSGKAKLDDVSADLHFGNSDDDDLKGFEFGANVVTGYQSPKGFLIAANFNQGFSNLIPGDAGNSSIKSHYFGIRLGYVLRGKKS